MLTHVRRGEHSSARRMQTTKFTLVVSTAFVLSFVLVGGVLLAQLGWSRFWHQVANPAPDAGAYDLLMATCAGAVGVFFALYFSSVIALAAIEHPPNLPQIVARLSSWWTFGPFLYFCCTLNLLVAAAWGFQSKLARRALAPRHWSANAVVPNPNDTDCAS